MLGQDAFFSNVTACKDRFLAHIKSTNDTVTFITHHDADGIAAGAIIALSLGRSGIPFQGRVIRQLAPKYVEGLVGKNPADQPTFLIFIDCGSGQLEFLAEHADLNRALVIDHHEPRKLEHQELEKLIHVNPWLHGIDGSREISAAGVAYYFAKALDPANVDLAPLAITGALGDMQDTGENASVTGLNRLILQDGINHGLITEHVDIKIFGRHNRPIHLALSTTTNPFIPGLSGDETACIEFLKAQEIPLKKGHFGKGISEGYRTFADLDKTEKSKIVTALMEWALKRGLNPNTVRGLIGNVYTQVQEDPATSLKDLREFASALNSCGRLGSGDVGLSIAMGDRREIFLEGQQLITDFKNKLSNYLEWARGHDAIKKRDNLQVVEGGNYIHDTMIGTVITILMTSKTINKDLPVIGLADIITNDGSNTVRVSAKGTTDLVKKGLNLDVAIRETLQEMELDTFGGGHPNAAGAEVPGESVDRFLRLLGRRVAQQMNLDTGVAPVKTRQTWF